MSPHNEGTGALKYTKKSFPNKPWQNQFFARIIFQITIRKSPLQNEDLLSFHQSDSITSTFRNLNTDPSPLQFVEETGMVFKNRKKSKQTWAECFGTEWHLVRVFLNVFNMEIIYKMAFTIAHGLLGNFPFWAVKHLQNGFWTWHKSVQTKIPDWISILYRCMFVNIDLDDHFLPKLS